MTQPSPEASAPQRILIACIGNIFFGDDGFGVEVARRLQGRGAGHYPENVEVNDFGLRGMDLAYSLLDGYDTVVLIDAFPQGGTPGTLYLIEPDLSNLKPEPGMATPDGHSMDPVKVLAFAKTLGAPPTRILLVGCEPIPGDYEEMQVGLSEPVKGAIDGAVEMVDNVVKELLGVQQHT